MLAGAIPVGTDGVERVIFRTPIFVIFMAALCVSILHSSFKQRFTWKKLGFYLSHLGIILLLGGALLGMLYEEQVQFAIPISETMDFWEIPKADGDQIELGFGFGVTNFNVDRFEPDYALYQPVIITKDGITTTDYEFIDRIRIQDDMYDLGTLGTVSGSILRLADNNWREQHYLPGGEVLVKYPQEDQHYLASFRIRDDNDELYYYDLKVNHPVDYSGWRFYLMSYDQSSLQHVVLSARNDPGRNYVVLGIWIVMIGTAIICWNKQKPLFKGGSE